MGDKVPGLTRNWISMLGMLVVTGSAILFLAVFLLDLFGIHANPYIGIVFFLIVPGIFIIGLLLIPLGMLIERHRRHAGLPARREWPRIDLNRPAQRRVAMAVFVLTMANILIVSLAAYRGIEFMDSPAFCGQVCHEVMEPEFAAYQDGPHSRVTCVQCHIGPGASFFVRSKLDGTRQVLAVMMNSHSRPIPSPVHNLRPAREVCEQCHWPEKFHGDKVVKKFEYADDEQVTETVTTLRIHVGGGSEKLGVATGIHWHMNVANEVEYIATDDKRMVIPWVRVKDRTGNVREYFTEGVTQDALEKGERRVMDCVDCHNRPSHTFSPTPENAVDAALASGEMPKLPFVRREAVAALKVVHQSKESAHEDIAARLRSFYQANGNGSGTQPAQIDRAVLAAQQIYSRNVFPKMNVTFGSYPNHIGHMHAPGCFRCHDDTKKTTDGRVLSQTCTLCHEVE